MSLDDSNATAAIVPYKNNQEGDVDMRDPNQIPLPPSPEASLSAIEAPPAASAATATPSLPLPRMSYIPRTDGKREVGHRGKRVRMIPKNNKRKSDDDKEDEKTNDE